MTKGLLTTSVGSFGKPDYLQKARNEYSAGRLDKAELDRLTLQATKEVIELQEQLGLDVDETQHIYLRDSNKVAVPANRDPMLPAVNRLNGNGLDDALEGRFTDAIADAE